MAENSAIEWTDHTFNPWEGCQKVGPGCDHCYAETRNARFGGGTAPNWGPGAPRRLTSAANWRKPLAWDAASAAFAEQHGRRQRVFCASLADVFDNAVEDMWRADLANLIDATPNLDWLLLTKRIGNAAEMLEIMFDSSTTRPNVWIGATVVNQTEADRDILKLLATPAAKRFLSIEPMLGPINLGQLQPGLPANAWLTWLDGLDWVICGGESGPSARPMHPDWARSLRDQCSAAGVPFLFKQWGEWRETDGPKTRLEHRAIGKGTHWLTRDGCLHETGHFSIYRDYKVAKLGKKLAGRLLDGIQHDGTPGSAAV